MPLPEFKFHAQRLLNPFQGTAQIVETSQARAISTDGLNWRIHIRSDIYKMPWGSLAVPAQNQRHFVCGLWSRSEGLARLPIHPDLYQEHVEQSVADLITLLHQLQADIPFPLQDRFELWLFDSKREQPVALIASCQSQEEIDISKHLEWYPATRADTTFITSAFSADQQRATIRLSAQDLLQNAVRQRCNRPYAGYWITRQADASGIIVHDQRGQPDRRNELIAAEHFPACLLTDDWHDAETARLVADFHAWQAPLLLMLPLADSQRRDLEIHAARQPLLVHRYHRLYPHIHDPELLRKVLVEAVLRQADTTRGRDIPR